MNDVHVEKKRDGGTEIFRCLMMFLVVLCHVAGAASFRTEQWVVPIIAVTNWAVPGFVAISGWYGIRFSWKKWFVIWGLTLFYSIVAFVAGLLANRHGFMTIAPTFKFSGGWFIGPYLALMILSPFLNEGIDALKKRGVQTLITAWGGLLFLTSFVWICSISPEIKRYFCGSYGGMGGKTVFTLIVIYVSARTARLLELDRLSLKTVLPGLTILVTLYGLVAMLLAQKFWATDPHIICWNITNSFGYDAPLTVLVSVGLFILFRKWSPPLWISRIARFCGPSMLSIYLLHVCSVSGITLTYGLPIHFLAKTGTPPPIIVPMVTIWCFGICLFVDLLRRFSWRGICALFHIWTQH